MSESQDPGAVLAALYATIEARKGSDPKASYVASLLAAAPDKVLKKIGEEATETVIAAKAAERAGEAQRAELVHELADLWFHTLVLMAAYDLPLSSLTDELARRAGRSGHDEKASRAK